MIFLCIGDRNPIHPQPLGSCGPLLYRDWSIITGKGLHSHVEGRGASLVLPLQKGGGGGVIAMLKGGGGTHSFGVV